MSSDGDSLYCVVFGQNSSGQAGLAVGDEILNLPHAIEGAHQAIQSSLISRVVCHAKQTFIITSQGVLLSAGENDNNELGRSGKRSLFHRIDALEAFVVTDVCVGNGFVMAVLSDGKQVSWGRNDYGQLGLGSGNREYRNKPKISNIVTNSQDTGGGFCAICAGDQHSVGIARNGNIYTWGGNAKGQLGDGFLNSCPTPQLLKQLSHRPIIAISCGENHTLALTVGGQLFSWGANDRGQLGHGDTTHRLRPEPVRQLKAARTKAISAGKQHSCVISFGGALFSFGSNIYGQCGTGINDNADSSICSFPRVVEKLREDGKKVVDVSCGSYHTIILVKIPADTSTGETNCVYVCGLNSSGQLGTGDTSNVFSPQKLKNLPASDRGPVAVQTGGCASMLSFVFSAGNNLSRTPLPSIDIDSLLTTIAQVRDNVGGTKTLNFLREMVASGYGSISVLNASFRPRDTAVGGSDLNLNLYEVRSGYDALLELNNEHVLATLGRATLQMAQNLRSVLTDDSENLNVFLIAFENPLLLKANMHYVALERIINGVLALPEQNRGMIYNWLNKYPSEYFARVVQVMSNYLSFALYSKLTAIDPSPIVMVLESLYLANTSNSNGNIIPNNKFVNSTLSSNKTFLLEERRKHRQAALDGTGQYMFNFCDYGFLLSDYIKSEFLRLDYAENKHEQRYYIYNQYLAPVLLETAGTSNASKRRGFWLRDVAMPRGLQLRMEGTVIYAGGLRSKEGNRVMSGGSGVSVNQYHDSNDDSGDDSDVDEVDMSGITGTASPRQSREVIPARSPLPEHLHFGLYVDRDHLLTDLLSTLNISLADSSTSSAVSVVYLPLSVKFTGEEGVDVGGISKEALTLAIKELIERTRVLQPTQDNRYLWFARTHPTGVAPNRSSPSKRKASGEVDKEKVLDAAIEQIYVRNNIDLPPPSPPRTTMKNSTSDADKNGREEEDDIDVVLDLCRQLTQRFGQDVREQAGEYSVEFTLGLLHGFAAYHACLINLPLPPCLYKFMNATSTKSDEVDLGCLDLQDLYTVDRSLAASLQALLDYSEGDFQEVFGATFIASINPLLAHHDSEREDSVDMETEDLKGDNGSEGDQYINLVTKATATSLSSPTLSDAPDVTISNRQAFVQSFLQYSLYECTQGACRAFLAGLCVFFTGNRRSRGTLDMCTAEEVEVLLCGTPEVGDISLLRLYARYTGEYNDEHRTIQHLWNVISDLSTRQQRRFLHFVTGSDRVPVGGLEKVRLVIQSTQQSFDALPVAHTCFAILDLPKYESKAVMEEKLLLALDNLEGFGLA